MSSDLLLTIFGKRSRRRAMISAVSSTESVVWVMNATRSGSSTSSASTSASGLDQDDRVGRLAGRSLDLLVALVADQDDRVALLGELARLDVDLGDQRAGRVDRAQVPRRGVLVNRRGDAVGGEDDQGALGHLGLLLDEDRAALRELLDDVLVVDDLLADVDGRPVQVERLLDGLDGAVHPGAVAAGRGQQDARRAVGGDLGGHAHKGTHEALNGSRESPAERARPTAARLSGQTLSSVSSGVCQ